MKTLHLIAACMAMGCFTALASDEGETDERYGILKKENGEVIRYLRPGANAVCFPLFVQGEGKEVVDWAAKDAAEELVPIVAEPGSKLAAELGRYRMRAFKCSFSGETWACLLYSPRGTSRPLPMVVSIPGRGELGEDVTRQFNQRRIFDIVLSNEFQKKRPCHLLAISPPASLGSFVGGAVGTPNRPQRRAVLMMRKAIAQNGGYTPVDTSRLYITGFSFGGDAATRTAILNPGVFAADVSIGGLIPPTEFVSEEAPGCYWYICNEGEDVAKSPVMDSIKELQQHVNELGGEFRISVFPAVGGHDAWNAAWREESIWEWMFSKRLPARGEAKKSSVTAANARDEVPLSLEGAVCTASVSAIDEEHCESRPLDGLAGTYFEPASGFGRQDWWQVELKDPVSGRVKVETGDSFGAKTLKSGYVEFSRNGRTWRRGGSFSRESGRCEFRTQTQFQFLRIRSNQGYDCPFVIRQLQVFGIP